MPSLQSYDRKGAVIYLGTFSKSISPAIRVSYMALPKRLLGAYQEKCGFYASTVPKEQQRVLTAFLRQGYFERYLNKMRGVYKGKHDAFLAMLKKERWVKKISGDYAGMHLLVEINLKKHASEIVEEMKRAGVRVYALEEYMAREAINKKGVENTLLLGYGGLSEKEMAEGIRHLREM